MRWGGGLGLISLYRCRERSAVGVPRDARKEATHTQSFGPGRTQTATGKVLCWLTRRLQHSARFAFLHVSRCIDSNLKNQRIRELEKFVKFKIQSAQSSRRPQILATRQLP